MKLKGPKSSEACQSKQRRNPKRLNKRCCIGTHVCSETSLLYLSFRQGMGKLCKSLLPSMQYKIAQNYASEKKKQRRGRHDTLFRTISTIVTLLHNLASFCSFHLVHHSTRVKVATIPSTRWTASAQFVVRRWRCCVQHYQHFHPILALSSSAAPSTHCFRKKEQTRPNIWQ